MVLELGSVVMRVHDLPRAIAFWGEALGYEPRDPVGPDTDFVVLVSPSRDGSGLSLDLDLSQAPAPEEPHMHLDLYARDATDQAAEIERLLTLGATRVDWPHYPPDPDFVVLADTEGNRFCVIDKSHG